LSLDSFLGGGGVAVDSLGSLVFADGGNYAIRRVDGAGIITSIVGGSFCNDPTTPCGDGGPATGASFGNQLAGLTFDSSNNLFIGDSGDNRVRRVDSATGIITTVAGNGTACADATTACGDGGLATAASLASFNGMSVAVDGAGNLFLTDGADAITGQATRVRRVDAVSGIITTVVGNGASCTNLAMPCGDGGLAASSVLYGPQAITFDHSGNLFIADGNRVRRVDAQTQTISSVAGNAMGGFSGDGGLASAAGLNVPSGLWIDGTEHLFIADTEDNRIREVPLTPTASYVGVIHGFGSQLLGVQTVAQSITLGNAGGDTLKISSISVLGTGFASANTCTSNAVAPLQICTVSVTFKPTTVGSSIGSLTITTNDPTNPIVSYALGGAGSTVALTALAVIPANPSIAGQTRQFAATGTYSDGSTQVLTDSVTWVSGTPAIATITVTGLATGVAIGTSKITASSGAISGTTVLTVTAPQTGSASAGPFAYVPVSGANAVSVFDVTTNHQVATVPVGAGPVYTAVSPNGSFVYTTNFGGGSVSVIDSVTNTVVATIPVGALPFGLAVTPDNSTVYVAVGGSGTNFVSVIDTATQIVVTTVPVGISPGFVAVTPDGMHVYVSNGGSNSLSVISVATNTVIATIPVGVAPQSLAISPDGKTVYVVCPGSNVVSVVDTASNTLVRSIPVGNEPLGISITPDGSTAYVAEYLGAATAVVNLATNSIVGSVPVGTNPRGSAVTPDGAFAWQTNLSSGFISVVSTATNTVATSIPVGGGVYNVAIAPGPATSQPITQPLSPTAPNTFNFGPDNFTVQYPPGTNFSGVSMTAVAAQTAQQTFKQRVAGTEFANATCIVYSGAGGNCVDYQVTCSNAAGVSITCPSVATPSISVKTSFDSLQQVINPGFLTTPIGTNDFTNIFDSFYLLRIDPTMKGRTRGFSEFLAVDLGANNAQGAGTLSFRAPLQQNNARIFPVGTVIPVQFQLTSLAHPGLPVTDAIAGLTVAMVSDANGNATSNIVLAQATAFTYTNGSYSYSLNTTGYAPGVYNVTVYGNAFVAQQVRFTLPAATSGVHLVTTLQSLTLNSNSNQYVAVFSVSNPGTGLANGVIVTSSLLNSAATSTALPLSLGDIRSGGSTTVTLTYPASAGGAGSRGVLTINESYAGGTGGGGSRVVLP
jgi:YVTN family beta-propeller protein